MDSIDIEIARYRALHGIACGLMRLKWLRDAERLTLAMHRHAIALKAGFKPEQPRDERGRWTNANGSGVDVRIPSSVPEIPKEKPTTSQGRVAAYKIAARALIKFAGPVGIVFEATSWLYNHRPLIEAYNDPPKSLDELQQNVSLWRLGYDTHHVVEKSEAKEQGDPKELINGSENLVSIPRMKHWEINAWYQTENPVFGGMTPRAYLEGKNWETRRTVGIEALKKTGVLKP